MKTTSILFLFAMVVGSASNAFAYDIWKCEMDDPIEWEGTPRIRASANGFPDGHSRSAALAAAVARWNNAPADFQFNLTWNDGNGGLDNGQNEIWFTADPDIMNGAPAIAYLEDDCGDFGFGDGNSELEEADVIFACDAAWVNGCAQPGAFPSPVRWHYGTSRARLRSYGGTQRLFRGTAMHELGHALGLEHESLQYNIMGNDRTHVHTYGDVATAYPGEDASNGAVRLYGLSNVAREDVAVVHWLWNGVSGEYSTHSRTRILDDGGLFLPQAPGIGVDGLGDQQADAGQRIRVEFTFENNGSNSQSDVPVDFYLSRDRVLGGDDVWLAGTALTLTRNSVVERRQVIDLPAGLASGDTYFIIAAIDPRSDIAEVYEDNNFTYSTRFVVR